MAKFVWQDGTLVSKAKVEINGTIYEVDPEEYSGSTPLSASNLNAMVDSTYSDLKGYADEKNTYSTDEIVVGTWIDGKPIYRKVINFGALPNATSKNISTGLLINEANIVNYYGIATGTSGNLKYALTLPDINPNGADQATRLTMNSASNYYMLNILTGIDRSNYTAYIVIEYTKN